MFSIVNARILSVGALAVAAALTLGTSYDVNCNVNLFGLTETQLKWKWNGFSAKHAKPAAFFIGQVADVEWHGSWYPATVEEIDEQGNYYIHYVGYGCNWDEWVNSSRIRTRHHQNSKHGYYKVKDTHPILHGVNPMPKQYESCWSNCNETYCDSTNGASTTNNQAIPAASSFSKNENIKVEWHGSWYPATIEKVDNGKFFIHYTGYENSWDEWVTPARMKHGA